MRHLALVIALLLFSGCSFIDDKINENLPEVGIAGGILGLNGEDGVEMVGSVVDAGKGAFAEQTIRYNQVETFNDVNVGDWQGGDMSTFIGMVVQGTTAVTLEVPGNMTLPTTIELTSIQLNRAMLADAVGHTADLLYYFYPASDGIPSPKPISVMLTKANCTQLPNGMRCPYNVGADGVEELEGLLRLITGEASGIDPTPIFSVISLDGDNSQNWLDWAFDLTVESATSLTGATATIRLGEFNASIRIRI